MQIPTPTIIPRSEHCISRANISQGALRVLRQLRTAGYLAYLVGGGVRDLLLGREPKDFDVATNAHPEQVRQVFGRNCHLIGRRFRLAHVRMGREIIEVATFRALNGTNEANAAQQLENAQGMILRDNIYGSIEEDAIRRDFTVNALYYNIADFSLVDFGQGLEDLQAGVLRLLGDPETRFREDPVRMLRAARFAAKLGFNLDPGLEALLPELGHLLHAVPTARLYDETLKLFQGGHGRQAFEKLRHFRLFEALFPDTEYWLADESEHFPNVFVSLGLANTDVRVNAGLPVSPGFLFAVFLWEPVRRLAEELKDQQGLDEYQALTEAASVFSSRLVARIAVPRRFTQMMTEIWQLQPRLQRRQGKGARRFLSHPRFRAAYDFLLLRAQAGEVEQGLADWWTQLQAEQSPLDEAQRPLDEEPLEHSATKPKRRRRRSKKKSEEQHA